MTLSMKVNLYFVPGLAAGKEIFKNLKFDNANFNLFFLEWLTPKKNETLANYALRMTGPIAKNEHSVLIGVSFGGVMVQEMANHLPNTSVVIISSIKSRTELPKRLKLLKNTGLYKILPTGIVAFIDDFTRFAIGPKSKKRLQLYNEYMAVKDKVYLDWAIKQIIHWDPKYSLNQLTHIHGDADAVFPLRYIKNAIIVQNGTHVMILNKAKKISKLIENCILQDLKTL